MNTAYTVWTWLLDPFNGFSKLQNKEDQQCAFEKAAREISYLGYTHIEHFNIIVETYGDEPDRLKDLLGTYALNLSAVYTYLKLDFEAELLMAKRCISLLQQVGGNVLNLQAPKRIGQTNSVDVVLDTAKKADTLGKLAKDAGIFLCMHPHWGSSVESEEDIRIFTENTDSDSVHLCIDTAHTQLLDMDPARIIRSYADRIRYIHLKDLWAAAPKPGGKPMERFCALGQGVIDFPSVFSALKDIGYDDTVCVELDYPVVCNFQSAQESRAYLKQKIGV